jgi:rhodanese-related sulfurtransferase
MKHTHVIHNFSACFCVMVLMGVGGCEKDSAWDDILSQVREDFPDVRMMTTQQLADWQADPQRDPPLLLDTRTAQEYEVSHLRGAVLADSDSALRAVLDGIDPDRAIVVYCSVGYRSAAAAQKIQGMGFKNVTNLEGSIFAWANQGRPVFRGGEPTDKVHPYDEQWGKLLDERYHPAR